MQTYLKSLDKTIVVVSHDRAFLDNVAREIILFRDRALTYHPGEAHHNTLCARSRLERLAVMSQLCRQLQRVQAERGREAAAQTAIEGGHRQEERSHGKEHPGMSCWWCLRRDVQTKCIKKT